MDAGGAAAPPAGVQRGAVALFIMIAFSAGLLLGQWHDASAVGSAIHSASERAAGGGSSAFTHVVQGVVGALGFAASAAGAATPCAPCVCAAAAGSASSGGSGGGGSPPSSQ
jgi:hypothetical protein